MNDLDGEEVLALVGERTSLPRGDLDRVANQGVLLETLDKVVSRGTALDPQRLDAVLAAVRGHWPSTRPWMRSACGGSRSDWAPPDGPRWSRAPCRWLGREGTQSVVYLNDERAVLAWDALRVGDMETLKSLL